MNTPKPRQFVPEQELHQESCFTPSTPEQALQLLASDDRIELILGKGGDLEFVAAKTQGHPKANLIISSYHNIWLQLLSLPHERHGHAASKQNTARFFSNTWLRQTTERTSL